MYRINVLTRGKYGNTITGYRYCFFKKTCKGLINTISNKFECDIEVEKLVRIHKDIFAWSDCLPEKLADYLWQDCDC